MELRNLTSLPVGAIAWSDGTPLVTIVVKATYQFDFEREIPLARKQDRLGLDRVENGELVAATDFAPRKGATDVIIVGEAHAAVPSHAISIRVAGPGFDKTAVARSDAAARKIPLTKASLGGATLGPQPWSMRRWELAEGAFLSPEGPPLSALRPAFDYSFFNAAPADQRVRAVAPGATFWLEGLVPGRDMAYVRLSLVEPALYRRTAGAFDRVPFACDTILFDTKRAVAVLTFRADVRTRGDQPELLLALGQRNTGPTPQELSTWARDVAPLRVTQAEDLLPKEEAPKGASTEVGGAAAGKTLPFVTDSKRSPPSALPVQPAPTGTVGVVKEINIKDVWPFGRPLAVSPVDDPTTTPDGRPSQLAPPTERDGHGPISSDFLETETFPAVSAGETTVAKSVAPDSVTVSRREESPLARTAAITHTTTVGAIDTSRPALPFAGAASAGQRGPAPMRRLGLPFGAPEASPAPKVIPAQIGATTLAVTPPPAAPVRLPPPPPAMPAPERPPSASASPPSAPTRPGATVVELLALDKYAALYVAIVEGGAPPEAALAKEELAPEESFWLEQHARYKALVDEEAQRGKCELALKLGRALRQARDRQSSKKRELTLDEYTRLQAEVDASADPVKLLEARRLTARQWETLRAEWRAKIAQDDKLAKQASEKLALAKRDVAMRAVRGPKHGR